MKVSNLPNTEFQTMVIKMLKLIMGRMDKFSENVKRKKISIKKKVETIKKEAVRD